MLESRWFWPAAAAVIAVTAAGAAAFRSGAGTQHTLPEESAISGTVFAKEIQAHLPFAGKAETAPQGTLPAQEQAYVLKLEGDTLSIYKEGKQEAEAVYELPAGWLPDYDRILLEYGMRVENAEELRELIEDYIS